MAVLVLSLPGRSLGRSAPSGFVNLRLAGVAIGPIPADWYAGNVDLGWDWLQRWGLGRVNTA